MKTILLLLIVSSEIFILSSCLLIRQYHYVNQSLSWTEAQTYCRQKHTDLATIDTSEEMDQVRSIVSSTGFIWIGLYSNINWRWSDGFIGGLTGNNYWTLEDSFDSRSDQICMVADWSSSNRLFESSCSSLLPFVCYNGTQQNPDYVFVNETMNWSSAQRYCRQMFTDLVTMESSTVWKNIQNVVSPKQKSWIGLYRDSNISWSDGRNFSFYQTPFSFFLFPDLTSGRCCLQHGQTRGHWHFDSCERRFPFICHELLKVKTHVVKLRLKTENSDILNDAAVKQKLLEKLQEKLKENGVSGVEVKWRQTTDGKVFNQEEKKRTEF